MPNSTSIATPVTCQQCGKILRSKRNLRRYEQKNHKFLPLPPLQTVCDKRLESLRFCRKHEIVKLAQNMTSDSHCNYCHIIFPNADNCQLQFMKKRALAVWDRIETMSSAAPTESALRKKLRQKRKVSASIKDAKQGGN